MTDTTTTAPSKAGIRAEIDATSKAFHELLSSLSAEDWKKPSANPAWRVGQLMWHIAWAGPYFTRGVEQCLAGKATNPPRWLLDIVNPTITRLGSRGAKPDSVARKWDEAVAGLLAKLETIQDGDWQKSVDTMGQRNTVESSFRALTTHFREHEADILKGLGRA
jgi:hypothetical protein